MKRSVIDLKDLDYLLPVLKGKRHLWVKKMLMRIFNINEVNDLYARSSHLKGAYFAESILKDLSAECLIGNMERLKDLPEGAFITVSNHPYGGLDGIMLINIMTAVRPDYKLMVNRLLSMVEAMEDHFISVKPKVGKRESDPLAGMNGIRETLLQLREGHPVGFFPAGAVSMIHYTNFRIRDREWQKSILKLIRAAKVPVLPIRFLDGNSRFFYILGLINWRIRIIRLPYELFNKYNKPHRVIIGELIPPEEIGKYEDYKSLGKFLKKTLYALPVPKKWSLKPDLKPVKQEQPDADSATNPDANDSSQQISSAP